MGRRVLALIVALGVTIPAAIGFDRLQESRAAQPTIEQVQERMTPLFLDTARIFEPDYVLGPRPVNAIRDTPFDDAFDAFDYDRCDYWWNAIFPGWYTSISTAFRLDERTPYQLDRVMLSWTRLDGTVEITGDSTGLTGYRASYHDGDMWMVLEMDPSGERLWLTVADQRCLQPA